MATLKKRITVVFSLTRYRRLGDFRFKVMGVSATIAGNTTIFATPVPTVLVVDGHISDFDDAQTLVEQRALGAVAVRDEAMNIVVDDMRAWVRYVQGLVDAAADFEAGMIIAEASGFDIKVNGVYIKPPLRVVQTPTPGTIRLIAIAAGSRSAYEWQQSINNGTTWTNLQTTNVANTTVTGLNSGTRYAFRFRSIVNNTPSAWSSVVSIVIQ